MSEVTTPYDEGWSSGYKDEAPNCPYAEGTEEYAQWWLGYIDGSYNN